MTCLGPPQTFFAFASNPAVRAEAVSEAAKMLTQAGALTAVPWTQLKTGGRFIIDVILEAITGADIAAFDVTGLNHNVMFELGFAIGSDKKIWLLRDESDEAARRDWDRVKLLTTVGYTPFTNADHIVADFHARRPDEAEATVFQATIRDYLEPSGGPALLYLPSLHENEPGRQISRRVRKEERTGIRVIIDDPSETTVRPLSWYAQQIYTADAVVAHYTSPRAINSHVHNARCALVSGLARGMNKPLLMLAGEDYTTPIDYRDSLFIYQTSTAAVERVGKWLEPILERAYANMQQEQDRSQATRLHVELKSLRFGDPVAENEAEGLVDYFVETAAYLEVLARAATVFVGRKGTGKTANLLAAAAYLGEDKRNLVVVIKPYSYELENVVTLLRRYKAESERGYLIEALWKFLIYSEIANEAYLQIDARGAPVDPASDEGAFMSYMDATAPHLRDEFAVRLETAVNELLALENTGTVGERRARISEALHGTVLQQLRERLGRVLKGKRRVAVLVDNLDKAWTRDSDVSELAAFVLGLLSSIERITEEFAKRDRWREPVTLTLAVFLRSDIYSYVSKLAREPDKIAVSRLVWSDPTMLARVIEERYLAAHEGDDPAAVWERFFCPSIAGVPTRKYLLSRTLPRPRDLIYLCSGAIASAVNRRQGRVEEDDVRRAEEIYSQFALEALLVENGIAVGQLEGILFEFAGAAHVLSEHEVTKRIMAAGIGDADVQSVIEHLEKLSFLGLEVRPGGFQYSYDFTAPLMASAVARRTSAAEGRALCYEIHPAFRSYLQVDEGAGGRDCG